MLEGISLDDTLSPDIIDSQEAIVGYLLKNPDEIPQFSSNLKVNYFTLPQYRTIYQALLELSQLSVPIDAIQLETHLSKSNSLDVKWIHRLAGENKLVRKPSKASIYRSIERLIDVNKRIELKNQVAKFYNEIDCDIVPMAELREAAEKFILEFLRSSVDESQGLIPISETIESTLEETIDLTHRIQNGLATDLIDTGWPDIDRLTGGWGRGDLIVVAARTSMGKAQPIETKVRTISGWMAIGDLKVGDRIASVDGKENTVIAYHPRGLVKTYRIKFADGRSTECCEDHLWTVKAPGWKDCRTVDTKELIRLHDRSEIDEKLYIPVSSRFGQLVFSDISYVGLKDSVCITVSHDSGLYICNDYIVTHNSAFVGNGLLHIARSRPVALFSLEMPTPQIERRYLAIEANVDSSKIRDGLLSPQEIDRMVSASTRLSALQYWGNDKFTANIDFVVSECRRLAAKQGDIGGIGIDYLQLLARLSANNDLHREVGRITAKLKNLAVELNCPIFCLSQLNRAVETRNDKRPNPSDLRESGSIEEDADSILFLYRDEYYNPNTSDPGIAEVIVAKNRNGSLGTVKLLFDKKTTKFKSIVN